MSDATLPLLLVLAAAIAAGVLGFFIPWAPWLGPSVRHGDRSSCQVALTFDDGPCEPWTGRVLDVLAAEQVTATFFVVGANVRRQPALLRRIVAEGHAVGNHSWSHTGAGSLTGRMLDEVQQTNQAIEGITGISPRLVRPPFGHKTPWFLRAVSRHGQITVLWDVVAGDWRRRKPTDLAHIVVHRARPGSIVLLHDGQGTRPTTDRTSTIEALPLIIRGLRHRGFTLVSVPALLGLPAYSARAAIEAT